MLLPVRPRWTPPPSWLVLGLCQTFLPGGGGVSLGDKTCLQMMIYSQECERRCKNITDILNSGKHTRCPHFLKLTLPVTITSKRMAYTLWSVRNSVPFSVLKYFANLQPRTRKREMKRSKTLEPTTKRTVSLDTWSCSLWRFYSLQMVRPAVWRSTSVYSSQHSGPGYTSTRCLFLFLHPERKRPGYEVRWICKICLIYSAFIPILPIFTDYTLSARSVTASPV